MLLEEIAGSSKVRERERRGDRVAGPVDERTFAKGRRSHGRARARRRTGGDRSLRARWCSPGKTFAKSSTASLLHDFGKIGVREQVLVKGKKLYEAEFELVRQRIEFAVRSLEAEILRRKLRLIEEGGSKGDFSALDGELEQRRAELLDAFAAIESANEPTV